MLEKKNMTDAGVAFQRVRWGGVRDEPKECLRGRLPSNRRRTHDAAFIRIIYSKTEYSNNLVSASLKIYFP